jgi:hypothetical protein
MLACHRRCYLELLCSLIIDTHHNHRARDSATRAGCSGILITQCSQKQPHLCQQAGALHLPLTPRDVITVNIRKYRAVILLLTVPRSGFRFLLCVPHLTIKPGLDGAWLVQ